MHAYVTNANSRWLKRPIEGILLYPKVGREQKEEYDMPNGDKISFRAIDLGAECVDIAKSLNQLIGL
jgi:hypothetical protein